MAGSAVVYISNLPYEAHEAVVRDAFEGEQIGVSSVQLLKKGSFNRCRNSGLACVTLAKAADVDTSCNLMDGKLLFGRPMIVRKDKFEPDQPGYGSTAAAAAGPAVTAKQVGGSSKASTAAAAAAAGGAAR